MGERIAVKPGSHFERTSSQKQQLALVTEKSTVGISLFQDMASQDSGLSGASQDSGLSGASQDSGLLGTSDSQHSLGSSHEDVLGVDVARGAAQRSQTAREEPEDSVAAQTTVDEQSCSRAEAATPSNEGGVIDVDQHLHAPHDMTGETQHLRCE